MATRETDVLRPFSDRLLLTMRVFFRVERRLSRSRMGLGPKLEWETQTALLESFAMHTRGLADFFFTYRGSRHKTDAFAFHFFDSSEAWSTLMPGPGPWLRRVRFRPEKGSAEERADRFGEQIAHLNYHAQPASSFVAGWPTMQLANEIGVAAWAFIQNVDPTLVVANFRDEAAREVPVRARLDGPLLPLVLWSPPSLRGRP